MEPDSGELLGGPEASVAVRVMSAGGSVVATGTLLDTVEEIRGRAAASLGVPPAMVLLLFGGRELPDGEVLKEEPGAATLDVLLVRLPCAARPEQYESFIVPCAPHQPLNRPGMSTDEALAGLFARHNFVRPQSQDMALVRIDTVEFPAPQDININMMPFVIGDEHSIPEEYRQYWPMVEQCRCLHLQQGRIGYLTIHEGRVPSGEAQRRPGLHVETTCVMAHGGRTRLCHHWGLGKSADGYSLADGIYMASTVAGSSRVWDAKLQSPEKIVGELGDVEHLRGVLGEGTLMGANELFWITDTTPHESVPIGDGAYRQYFRLVSSSVSVWYEKHSTKNRLGIVPDPARTKVLSYDKFDHSLLTKLSDRDPHLPPYIL